MRKTLFRQMLTYLLLFCVVICAAGYAVITLTFDDYYETQQRDKLKTRMDDLTARYDAGTVGDLDTAVDTYNSEYGIFVDISSGGMHYGAMSQGMGRQGINAAMRNDNIGRCFVSSSGQGGGHSTQWLSYLTEANDSSLLLGRISYASMDAAVMVAGQFLLWFGVAAAAAFILFAFFFSRSMSRPLRKLNDIAHEMGELNFSMRYGGKRRDEIGQLGAALNTLTTKLENTITQLKGELSKEKTLEKMRTQFTAQVSHELQTPLSVIKGYAEALADDVYKKEETGGIYDILINETQKISGMVSDLLDLSQMEAGAYVIRKQNFDLTSLVRKIEERYSALPHEKPFEIRLDADEPLMCFGDPLRIEQAVRNVLTNAIKHVEKDGVIGIRVADADGRTHIFIENEGAPIPAADLPHIFDSYFQGQTQQKGTGLGLAVTRHIIALHGGEISAHNTADGVLFDIALP